MHYICNQHKTNCIMETLVININLSKLCQKEEKQDTKDTLLSPAEVSESRLSPVRLHKSRAKIYSSYFRAMNFDKHDPRKVDELTRLCAQQYREDKKNGLL